MKKTILLLLCLSVVFVGKSQTHRLLFQTDYGDFKVLLYDYTPQHRDLILKSIQTKVYRDALFNRIISDFVVQGGEHDIDIEKREAADPAKQKPRLAPEFDDRAFHKVGALGAGRDGNPEKASFLNQIYFVVGKKITASELDILELKKSIKYTAAQRSTYLKIGGQPRLDHDFTVFGEIYEGLDVILKISKVKTDSQDYPLKQVRFDLSEIKD